MALQDTANDLRVPVILVSEHGNPEDPNTSNTGFKIKNANVTSLEPTGDVDAILKGWASPAFESRSKL